MLYYMKKGGLLMIFERTVKEIRGDYAVLVGESGVETWGSWARACSA